MTIHKFIGHFRFTATYTTFPPTDEGLAHFDRRPEEPALRNEGRAVRTAARFWGKIFGISFVFGVVTGIPLEFQFGTNWARFSTFAGGVIGQTLALEGIFAFFLESAFLGLFLYGEKRLGRRGHWVAALMVFLGSWLSGYFIIATNAWMQHPVGYSVAPDGSVQLNDFWALSSIVGHSGSTCTIGAARLTGAFVMAATGPFTPET